MRPELFQRMALRHDLDAHGLKAGDVAVLIDRVPHPARGEEGVVLEVFKALGESHAVAPSSFVEPLLEDEVLAVRPLARVG